MNPTVSIRDETRCFQTPIPSKSVLQAIIAFAGFLAICTAMYITFDKAWWLSLALAPLAADFLVRIFIIQHDCGHGSYFRKRRANDALGFACSLVTLAPYASWRRQHAGHHRIWNDLDYRQTGADIYSSCLTVTEYSALSTSHRLWYRTTRNPLVANMLVPPFVFLGLYRFPFDSPRSWRHERRAIYATNAALIAIFCGLGLLLGFGEVAAVQLPITALAAIIGVWLFSVQHRGETVQWVRHESWDGVSASLQSATYLRLPAVLQWFTGNIGYHHVHHLNPRIPNYRLQECHDSIPALRDTPALTLRSGFRAMQLVLWDEESGRMATIREIRLRELRS